MTMGITQQDPRFASRTVATPAASTIDYVSVPWIDMEGTFEDFWAARGKNLRQNLRKQRRRLEEQHGAATFEVLRKPAELHQALLDFAGLESVGWKAAGGSAIAIDNAQGRLYARVLAEFGAAGTAIAFRLSVRGRVIAVNFGLLDDVSVVILKTTYDETFKALSPGQLLHEQAFEWLFRNMAGRRIEFYGKTMDWHARWTDNSRMLFHVNVYRWAWLRAIHQRLRRPESDAAAPVAGAA